MAANNDLVRVILAPLVTGVIVAVVGIILTNRFEEQRAETDRQIEDNRAQDAALQAYLSQMSKLMTEEDLRTSKLSSEVRTLAHARTMTVIARLDQSRKTEVLRFLEEAQLIQCIGGEQAGGEEVKCVPPYPPKSVGGEQPIIALDSADLSGVQLNSVLLMYAHLHNTDLSNAHLNGAHLNNARLLGANLKHSELYKADLTGADLTGADLTDADLTGADLTDADLTGADLAHANLHSAQGITNEVLEKARSLEGAIMPDGSPHP